MPRLTVSVVAIALVATSCSVEPIEDPGIGAGGITTTVVAADGSALAEWHAEQDRRLVAYSELPLHLIDAVVAIEDQRFWIHSGVDPRAVARAADANLEAGEIVQGGSTITQQYVKNVMLTPEVSLERKSSEIGLALRLEESLTKEEILERYLNTIFWGEGAYGVGAAADRYFGKHVSQLSLDESALLAGIIAAPSANNPHDHPEAALERRRLVLEQMVELGWLDRGEADSAELAPLDLAPRGSADLMRFPYFTDEVRRRLLEMPALGSTPEERLELLLTGGLTIHTTLDPLLQATAEAAVSSVLPADGPDAALVAIDPRTGHVKAIVGGRDFYDASDPISQFNLATQGRRQAGSAFKPFALAAALEAGHDLDFTRFPGGREATIDAPEGVWVVANHEGAYYPTMSLREATVFSVNVPYAHLVDEIGADRVRTLAAAAGIGTDLANVPSIVLGTEEVRVIDMAEAYATLANRGIHTDPVLITRIVGPAGDVLYEQIPSYTQVMSTDTAEAVTSVLVEAVRRGTGQQAKIGRPVAGKTGTTEGYHDAWFVGYTPELVAAVWVGFAGGNQAMVSPSTPYTVTGGTWPAQIWARFGIAALSGVAYDEPPSADSEGLVSARIDTSTGFLAGPLCPRAHVADVQLKPALVPSVVCPIHNPPGLVVNDDGTVPTVAGHTTVNAVLLLEASGYTPSLSWDPSNTVFSPGTVLRQDPAPGTVLSGGSKVKLVIAGPEPGTGTPGVIGMGSVKARDTLEGLGFAVDLIVLADPTPEGVPEPGVVWAQSPSPGEAVRDRVTIWVNP
jgi:penicillin-binding protein 1A